MILFISGLIFFIIRSILHAIKGDYSRIKFLGSIVLNITFFMIALFIVSYYKRRLGDTKFLFLCIFLLCMYFLIVYRVQVFTFVKKHKYFIPIVLCLIITILISYNVYNHFRINQKKEIAQKHMNEFNMLRNNYKSDVEKEILNQKQYFDNVESISVKLNFYEKKSDENKYREDDSMYIEYHDDIEINITLNETFLFGSLSNKDKFAYIKNIEDRIQQCIWDVEDKNSIYQKYLTVEHTDPSYLGYDNYDIFVCTSFLDVFINWEDNQFYIYDSDTRPCLYINGKSYDIEEEA